MCIIILNNYEDVEAHIPLVIKNADNNRNSLGFYRPSTYQEQASKSRLWVAYDKENMVPVGHLMFGGKYPAIKVLQVISYARINGIGTMLVNDLVRYSEENGYIHIIARVAADLKANDFWDKMREFNL